jgi:hypothetical protein
MEENETHRLLSHRDMDERIEEDAVYTPNRVPMTEIGNAPEQGKFMRLIDDIIPARGNCRVSKVDNCFEKETAAIKLLIGKSADVDLQAREDSENHLEFKHELPPNLAFMQKVESWPKLVDSTVIEVPPDDSNPSAMTFFRRTPS